MPEPQQNTVLETLFEETHESLSGLMKKRISPHRQYYRRWVKRGLDLTISLIALIALLPLLLLIYLTLLLLQGGNPLFLQKRIGRHCKEFSIIKFKTMRDTRDENGELLPDELRTTRIGKILRSTSLDELPEIINVVLGDMSIIGPRPWVPEQMATFTPHTCMRRMAIRPGITGLAQILGRNNLTFRQRICYDLRYQRNLTLRMDLLIFLYTFYKVLRRDGIAQRADALAPKKVQANKPKDPTTIGMRGNRRTPTLALTPDKQTSAK